MYSEAVALRYQSNSEADYEVEPTVWIIAICDNKRNEVKFLYPYIIFTRNFKRAGWKKFLKLNHKSFKSIANKRISILSSVHYIIYKRMIVKLGMYPVFKFKRR